MFNSVSKASFDKFTWLALIVGLIAYPLLYSTDFFGSIFIPLMPENFVTSLFSDETRTEWWYFHASNFAFHWVAFFFVWLALKKNNQKWSSIGVDWSWFLKYKVWFIVLLLLLIVASFIMPNVLYGSELPLKSRTHFIGPVTTPERLVMIVTAITAAITEEVIFRGFALTRLKRWVSNVWLILPLTVISFVLIHGEPRSLEQVIPLVIGALAFAVPFILMGLRRLEIIILIHLFIDAGLVLSP